MAVRNYVISRTCVNDVGASHIGNDVVTVTAEEVVVAEAALDAVVAAIAIDRVVIRRAGDEDVVELGAAEHYGIDAGIVQIVGIRPDRVGIVPDHQWGDLDAVDRDAAGWVEVTKAFIELVRVINL